MILVSMASPDQKLSLLSRRTLHQNPASQNGAGGGSVGQTGAADSTYYESSMFVDKQLRGQIKNGESRNVGTPEYFQVSEDLRQDYELFLGDYVNNLDRIASSTDAHLLSDPQFRFAKEILDVAGITPGMELSAKKTAIQNFLKTQRGLLLTGEVMQQVSNMIFIRNEATATVVGYKPDQQGGSGQIVDSALGRKAYNKLSSIVDKRSVQLHGLAITAASGVGAYHYDDQRFRGALALGTLTAVIPSAAYLGAKGLQKISQRVFREGVKIDVQRNSTEAKRALARIRRDPKELKFFEAMTDGYVGEQGIDRAVAWTQDSFRLQMEAGAPPGTLHTAEEFLLNPGGARNFDQAVGKVDRMRQEEFLKILKNKGIKDQWGQEPTDLCYLRNDCTAMRVKRIGGDVELRNYGGNLRGPERILDWYQARRNVVTEIVAQDAQRIDTRRESQARRDSTTIGGHITAMSMTGEGEGATEGALLAKKREKLTEQIRQIDGDINFVEELSQIEARYQDAFPAIDEVEKMFRKEFVGDIDIDTAIATRKALMDRRNPASVEARKARLPEEERRMFERVWAPMETRLVAAGSRDTYIDKQMSLIAQRVAAHIDKQRGLLDDEARSYTTQLQTLGEMQEQLRSSQGPLKDGSEKAMEVDRAFSDINSAFTEITGLGILPGDLTTKSFNDLMSDINTAGGWTAAENNKPENREKLERAIIEASAKEIEASDPRHVVREPEYNALIAAGVSENKLRVLTLGQVKSEVAHITPPFSDIQIRDAMEEARSRFSSRERATRMRKEQLQKQKTKLQEQRGKIDFKDEVADRTLAKKIVDGTFTPDQSGKTVYQRVVDEWTSRPYEFVDSTAATAADGYSRSEASRTHNQKGYYEILQVLSGYMSDKDRTEAFKIASRVVTPDMVMNAFNEELALGIATPTLSGVFDTVKARLDSSQMRPNEMYYVMRRLITDLQREYRRAIVV